MCEHMLLYTYMCSFLQDESMVAEVKNKLKRQCSIYLSEAETLQKELKDKNGDGEKYENEEKEEEIACKESEDHQVERLVNGINLYRAL